MHPDAVEIMSALANERPVFHSEADFQHALAWRLHEAFPEHQIRLEFKPFPDQRVYLDIWLAGDPAVAIELKYLTRRLEATVAGERFNLADQAAQDISRYDFTKDLVRLEAIVANMPRTLGLAILLTNDSAYWRPPIRDGIVDAAFRIHEGRTLGGDHAWASHAGKGTMAKREAILALTGSYSLAWRDYSTVPYSSYGVFRYLAVPIAGDKNGAVR